MPLRVTPDEVVSRLARTLEPPLVAIDGLPCSGKSTLAERIQAAYGFDCLYLDDFVRPEEEWPSKTRAAFPFEYIRYDEFAEAVCALASTGECRYASFDWKTGRVSKEPRKISLASPVIVEGVSSLNPILCGHYGLRVFVDSDRATTLDAAEARGTGTWSAHWHNLFLPSVDIYMKSHPEQRADLIVPGRGVL